MVSVLMGPRSITIQPLGMKKRSLGVVLTLVRVGAKGVALGLGQVLRQLGRAIAVEVRRARWPYRRPEMHDLLCMPTTSCHACCRDSTP